MKNSGGSTSATAAKSSRKQTAQTNKQPTNDRDKKKIMYDNAVGIWQLVVGWRQKHTPMQTRKL